MAHYFEQLNAETENRFWINNPSKEHIELAIRHGAVACTTNPAYCSKLIKMEPEYLNGVIDDVLSITKDIDKAAYLTYQRTAQRIMRSFLPLHAKSGGTEGFVTIQHDPREDEDTEATIASVEANRALGPNYMAKIPVIEGAMDVIEYCVEENIPICATEVFAISQARDMCERYERAAERSGNRPPFYLTHISGIFDEYIQKIAKRDHIDIDPAILPQAGLIIAKKEYRMLRERGFDAIMLGGGARGTEHFTGLVGGPVHITINWSTAADIIASGAKIEDQLNQETPATVVEELRSKFPVFAKAYDDDGLLPGEYAAYPPVQLFRNAFLEGWYLLLAKVAERKHALGI